MGWDCLAYKSYWLIDHFLLVGAKINMDAAKIYDPAAACLIAIVSDALKPVI